MEPLLIKTISSEASLVYRVSSRTDKATQRNLVSNNVCVSVCPVVNRRNCVLIHFYDFYVHEGFDCM